MLNASYTSVLMTRGLFPRLSKKCRGDSIVPNSWRSPNLSLSVSVVAEIPASGPRLGKEPAVTEGSGICPGIASDSVVTTARRQREKMGDILRRRLNQINEKHRKLCLLDLLHTLWHEGRKQPFYVNKLETNKWVSGLFDLKSVKELQGGICPRCNAP